MPIGYFEGLSVAAKPGKGTEYRDSDMMKIRLKFQPDVVE
jgi:hypothetical protein